MEHYLIKINALLRVFCERYCVTVALFDKWGNCITHRGGGIALCRLIRADCGLSEKCRDCDKNQRDAAGRAKRSYEYVCHAGIAEAIKPLFDEDGDPIGYLVAGKYRDEQIPAVFFEQFMEGLKPPRASLPEKMRGEFAHLRRAEPDSILPALDALAADLVATCELQSLKSEEIGRAIKFIDGKKGKATCTELCGLLYRSPRSLARFFAKMCGVTPSRFIEDRYLMRLEDRLMNTNDSVLAISAEFNCDYLYFFERFRRECGISPTEFRIRRFIGAGTPNDRTYVSRSDALPF